MRIAPALLLVAASAAGCSGGGVDVEVSNRCDVRVRFDVDAGDPDSAPRLDDISVLDAGETATFDVADLQEAYLWLLEPAADAPAVATVEDGAAAFVLEGDPCVARAVSDGGAAGDGHADGRPQPQPHRLRRNQERGVATTPTPTPTAPRPAG